MHIIIFIILLLLLINYWEIALVLLIISLLLFFAFFMPEGKAKKHKKHKNKHYIPPDNDVISLMKDKEPNWEIKNAYLPNGTESNKRHYYRTVIFENDFSTVATKPSIKDIWNQWDYYHSGSEQLIRRKRAFYNVVPLFIDKEGVYAKYIGSEDEIYVTTLKECECMDFSKRHLPCKHMYSLFHYLEHDNNELTDLGLSNPEIIAKINALSKRATEMFFKLLRNLDDNKCIVQKSSTSISPLIKAGLFVSCENPNYGEYMNQTYTKAEIHDILERFNVFDYKKSWRKSDLVQWINDNNPASLKPFFNSIRFLTLPEEMLPYYEQWIKRYHSRNNQ